MLRSLYPMLNYQIAAIDGVQGNVQDFLFDDESWIVHYLVAETTTALGERKVLILPFAVGRPEWEAKQVPVLLTREQIRASPPLEADMPVSRQFETGIKRPGSHLRSIREVLGYRIHGTDGEVGTIEDFIIEDTLWGMHHVVAALKAPHHRSILLSPESIRSISWPGKAVWVNLSLPELEKAPTFDPATPVNHGPELQPYDYYGRPVYSPPQFGLGNKPAAEQH